MTWRLTSRAVRRRKSASLPSTTTRSRAQINPIPTPGPYTLHRRCRVIAFDFGAVPPPQLPLHVPAKRNV
eukprot:741610-Rhodomonas_salina.1